MLLTNITKWAVLYYGLLMITLGIAAFYIAGSSISLVCGSSFGFLLFLSSLSMFKNSKIGAWAAFIITLFLSAFFSYRYSLTHMLMPALLAVISTIMLIVLLVTLAQRKKS